MGELLAFGVITDGVTGSPALVRHRECRMTSGEASTLRIGGTRLDAGNNGAFSLNALDHQEDRQGSWGLEMLGFRALWLAP